MSWLCRFNIHTDIVFHQVGDRYCTRFQPFIWEWALCHGCNNKLTPTRKIIKRQRELDAQIAEIKQEIKIYGRPLLTGITT